MMTRKTSKALNSGSAEVILESERVRTSKYTTEIYLSLKEGVNKEGRAGLWMIIFLLLGFSFFRFMFC